MKGSYIKLQKRLMMLDFPPFINSHLFLDLMNHHFALCFTKTLGRLMFLRIPVLSR